MSEYPPQHIRALKSQEEANRLRVVGNNASTPTQVQRFVDQLTIEDKHLVLTTLTLWADSDEGQDYRADLAAKHQPSVITAEDVFALLDPHHAAELKEDLGVVS